MFCPVCGDEFVEGMVECAQCRVPLVDRLPQKPPDEYIEFETVLKTGNIALIAVAQSLLESAGIEYFVKGEGLQDLFGLGRMGTGFNPIAGPIELQVDKSSADEARVLLSDLK